jgi:heme/copper-type cytochrome/quinol oxidase subunit 2
VHPITVIEILMSAVPIFILFVTAFLLPEKIRRLSIIAASSATILILLFFALRPFWIDYQVSRKTEKLNHYLEGKYPGQEWEISRRTGRQYNPYHLMVEFENEKGWTYTYSVVDEKNICQSVWTPPEGRLPNEGKHFERNECE